MRVLKKITVGAGRWIAAGANGAGIFVVGARLPGEIAVSHCSNWSGDAMRRLAMVLVLGMLVSGVGGVLLAQDGGDEGRAALAGMQRVTGEVTAISGSTLTVKTEDGTVQVVTTDNTRVMMNPGQVAHAPVASSPGTPGAVTPPPAPGRARGVVVKFSDLKVGDGVMAAGNLAAPNKTLHAAFVFATDAEQLKELKENLGKTYIAGKVTAIDLDNAKMTVERPDHVAQTIGFDESTSFKRGGRGGGRMGSGGAGAAPVEGGESITLADIKVGDVVRGTGSVKGGTFVPTQVVVAVPGQGGRRREGGAAPAAGAPGPQ